jgi:hypothetical protein
VAAQTGVTAIAAGRSHTIVILGTTRPPSFAEWAASFGLSGAPASGDADPDGDGARNGVEYILGSNPTTPGMPASPTVNLMGESMVFTFSRADASETADVTLTVEASTDLVTWPRVFSIDATTAASSPGVSVLENGGAPDTITVVLELGAHSRMFARLRVTVDP